MNKSRRVAVVGSGVAGIVTAWLLRDRFDVSLFEADRRLGGHVHSVTAVGPGGAATVDTGFMVFNRTNYPLLSALFDHLGIASYPTDMSFSASFDGGRLEYSGSDLNGLFGQRRNLVRGRFWSMLLDVARFNRSAVRADAGHLPPGLALGEFLDRGGFGEPFRNDYLYPMAAAIWSAPQRCIADFPAASFLRFFVNHGLVRLGGRPQWRTVEGGAGTYVARLAADLGGRARTDRAVAGVERRADGVVLQFADGRSENFDETVLAVHSDQALALLTDAGPGERRVLGAIRYQPNRVVLHRDPALMPRERRVWSSWNYLGEGLEGGVRGVSVTYWMNSLQRLGTRDDYFVSLNPLREPRSDRVVGTFDYQHPVFDVGALEAQRLLSGIQGRRRTWFAGAWTGYGFHEDGMRSAVAVAEALGATLPWSNAAPPAVREAVHPVPMTGRAA